MISKVLKYIPVSLYFNLH